MSQTLEAKIYSGASADPTLAGLLGTSPFRWYDKQLGQRTLAYPAVTMFRVSSLPDYTHQGLNYLVPVRMQFTCWDTQPEVARQVAVPPSSTWLATFTACEPSTGTTPNFVMNQRGGLYTETDPPIHQEILDVRIFNRTDL